MRVCILFIFILSVQLLHAEVYRYVDKDGRTHYVSDQSEVPQEYFQHLDHTGQRIGTVLYFIA